MPGCCGHCRLSYSVLPKLAELTAMREYGLHSKDMMSFSHATLLLNSPVKRELSWTQNLCYLLHSHSLEVSLWTAKRDEDKKSQLDDTTIFTWVPLIWLTLHHWLSSELKNHHRFSHGLWEELEFKACKKYMECIMEKLWVLGAWFISTSTIDV